MIAWCIDSFLNTVVRRRHLSSSSVFFGRSVLRIHLMLKIWKILLLILKNCCSQLSEALVINLLWVHFEGIMRPVALWLLLFEIRWAGLRKHLMLTSMILDVRHLLLLINLALILLVGVSSQRGMGTWMRRVLEIQVGIALLFLNLANVALVQVGVVLVGAH